jgi:DNA-binding transcriptional ArsR family regulator
MLDMLRSTDLPVADLVAPFRLSRPTMSQHLRVLRTSGLVRQRRLGRSRIYTLQWTQLGAIRRWIGEFDGPSK